KLRQEPNQVYKFAMRERIGQADRHETPGILLRADAAARDFNFRARGIAQNDRGLVFAHLDAADHLAVLRCDADALVTVFDGFVWIQDGIDDVVDRATGADGTQIGSEKPARPGNRVALEAGGFPSTEDFLAPACIA